MIRGCLFVGVLVVGVLVFGGVWLVVFGGVLVVGGVRVVWWLVSW
jgi:hypothetical protein